jgi:hypothetical protein
MLFNASFLFLEIGICELSSIKRKAFDVAKTTGFSGVVLVAKDGEIVFHEATGFARYRYSDIGSKSQSQKICSRASSRFCKTIRHFWI